MIERASAECCVLSFSTLVNFRNGIVDEKPTMCVGAVPLCPKWFIVVRLLKMNWKKRRQQDKPSAERMKKPTWQSEKATKKNFQCVFLCFFFFFFSFRLLCLISFVIFSFRLIVCCKWNCVALMKTKQNKQKNCPRRTNQATTALVSSFILLSRKQDQQGKESDVRQRKWMLNVSVWIRLHAKV